MEKAAKEYEEVTRYNNKTMKYLKIKKAVGQGSDDKKVFVNRKAKNFKVEAGRLSSTLQSRHLFMASPLKWVQQ